MVSCDTPEKRYERACTLYNEGTELRSQRLSEEAAERFLQALDVLDKGAMDEKTVRLEGQLKNNLGAMYNKHGLLRTPSRCMARPSPTSNKSAILST